MSKIKLSFNKQSTVDIVSVVFILASFIVTLLTAFGFKLSGDTSTAINAWVSAITLIAGSGGLLRNTSTVNNQPKVTNAASKSASQAVQKGASPSEDAK